MYISLEHMQCDCEKKAKFPVFWKVNRNSHIGHFAHSSSNTPLEFCGCFQVANFESTCTTHHWLNENNNFQFPILIKNYIADISIQLQDTKIAGGYFVGTMVKYLNLHVHHSKFHVWIIIIKEDLSSI